MSTDDRKGVVTFRATRITMIDAIGDALPASGRRWRRKYPLAVPDLADAILAVLPVVEPSALKAITEAERIIAERDEEITRQARVIRDVQAAASDMGGRCDDQFALNRGLREQVAEDKEQILALSQQLTAAYDAADEFRKAVDQAAEARHDIDLILDGVPGLSQDHPGQVGAVAELAERCKAAEAQNVTLRDALAGGHLLELADLRAKVAEYENAIAWNTSCTACARTLDSSIAEHERADKAERVLAPLTSALERFAAPGAWTSSKRQQAAREALVAAQAPPEPVVPADPYQGLGSGGMLP